MYATGQQLMVLMKKNVGCLIPVTGQEIKDVQGGAPEVKMEGGSNSGCFTLAEGTQTTAAYQHIRL